MSNAVCFCVFLLVFLCTASCGPASKDKGVETGGYADTDTEYLGLAFATVAKGYSSSSLYYLKLATGEITEILSGESGDPQLFLVNEKLYFFNRRPGNSNFRWMNPKESSITPSEQLALPSLSNGAPQDVISLGSDRLLLLDRGGKNSGKIIIIDATTGALLETLEDNWDTSPFRPRAFYRYETESTKTIFVLHQGRGADNTFNGSQQIFVLKEEGGNVTIMDQDPVKEKVQGIPLKYNNGIGFLFQQSAKPLIVSPCYGAPGCLAGVERFDPATLTVEDVLDFSSFSFYGGVFAESSSLDAIYAMVYKDVSYADFHVEKVNLVDGTLERIHDYPAESKGAEALFFDTSSETLYVGDGKEDGSGMLSIYRKNGTAQIQLPTGKPYSGLFIAQ